MQDFKSYTLDKRPERGQLTRRLMLVVVLLILISAGYLYLNSAPNDTHQKEPLTAPDATESSEDKLILPLSLPGSSDQSNETLPVPTLQSGGFLREAQAAEPVATETSIADEPSPEPLFQTQKPTREIIHKIKSGDSLATIFKQQGLSANLLHRIVHSSETAKQLTDIRPGEELHIALDDTSNLMSLRLVHNKISSLEITQSGEDFTATQHNREVEVRSNHVSGTIENSLYLAAKKVGLSEKLIMQLADIFGWDVDFALEIRSGDRFTVIYQEDYLDGEKLQDGPILAAEFINQGRTYRAIRYTDESGHSDYYTPEGRSMRKAFLRAPVDFRRISSKFTQERWHPVLGKKRPHMGVDYAAKTGTPIKAAGDGKVIFRGKKGGYGNAIIIQHGQTYTTLYGHLSKYNKSSKKGNKVKQGQIIGYVGQTGLATGPHLHYEFRVNGVHRNPLTVKLPAAEPVAKKYREDFLIKSQPLISQLELINRTIVADAQ
ncbi:MAG: peptidoglycan DD-metalloendopeptidase family protein [Candidatus Thiodiazotropha sp.]